MGGKPRVRRTIWIVWVSGYGAFEFVGTETEAEEMRAHKCNWERGIGRKWDTGLRKGGGS